MNKNNQELKSGFILIKKEEGPTSHAIVNKLRKITNIKKIGHAGTLDPFATGLLIFAIGRESTKKINNFVKLDKKYEAEIFLGKSTDTYDKCGKVIKEYIGKKINKKIILNALEKISRKKTHTPPMYSAKKIDGKKLYELARKNIEIKRPKQKIKIYYIKVKNYKWPKIKTEIHCSSGTYIRTIADDLGKILKCGAHLTKLKRTSIDKYNIKKAIKTEKLNINNWQKHLFTENF